MEPSFLTSQAIAVFGSINGPGMLIGTCREDLHPVRLFDVLALGPRLREDDGMLVDKSNVCPSTKDLSRNNMPISHPIFGPSLNALQSKKPST